MKRKHLLLLLAMAMCVVGFSACGGDAGSDDDGGWTEQPQFSGDAACYVVSDESADIASIELSEDGLYFIEKRDSAYGAKTAKAILKKLAKRKAFGSAGLGVGDDVANAIVSDTCTKQSEGVYVLNGYGTMTVAASGNNYVVKIQKDDGTEKTYETSRVKSAAATVSDTQLCRTWKFEKINFSVKVGSYSLLNVTESSWKEFYTKMKQFSKEDRDEDEPWTDEDEQSFNKMIANAEKYGLKQVVFTAAGRLYLSYGPLVKNYLWKWKNTRENTLWLWSYYDNDLDENGVPGANEWSSDIFFTTTDYPNYTAETTADIENGKLVLTDADKETEDGMTVETKFVITFGKN